MTLENYKLIFIAVGLIGILIIAAPSIAGAINPPSEAKFSELYLLGTDQRAENYPTTIIAGQNYSIYVGVGNHLGSSAYYVLYVKLGNKTDQMPNETLGTPSSLQPLYEYRFSVRNNENWERLLNFSASNASISGSNSQIKTLEINGLAFNVEKPAIWNSTTNNFMYHLIFELWRYNIQSNSIQFDDRFVNLNLYFVGSA